jgi:hypothetical protein
LEQQRGSFVVSFPLAVIGEGDMAKPIIYIDRSEISSGNIPQVREAVSALVDFVERREPQLISYGFYIDDTASTMTVVAVHPDSASLELHLRIGGPEFRKVGEFITLRLIEVFGELTEVAVEQLYEKARMLGGAAVVVRSAAVGFARNGASRTDP